jgi:hypothetical protein
MNISNNVKNELDVYDVVTMESIIDKNPKIARIILSYDFNEPLKEAKGLLEEIYSQWPEGLKVDFIVTCGGFIEFDWPGSIKKKIGKVTEPDEEIISKLVNTGEYHIKSLIDDGLKANLKKIANYITIGADSYLMDGDYIINSIELVYVVDLNNNNIYATGKSYPTPSQQSYLLRYADLNSHFINLDNKSIMVLGCHDLNLYSERSHNNAKGWRQDTINEFRKMARMKKPELVIHHPHYTDSIRIWSTALGGLKKDLPGIKFVSCGKYYNHDCNQRSPIESVLDRTKNIDTIDFILKINNGTN